jgi:COMPASS component BRE2
LEGRDPLAPPVVKKPKLETDGSTFQQDGMAVDADIDAKPARTWRPACERYAEFMQEQWEMDAAEEEEAKIELSKWQENTKREEEKAEIRKKKRREAEAKRKAKKAAEIEAKKREAMGLPSREDGTATPNQLIVPSFVGSLGPGFTSSAHPSPSPLRYSTAAYDLDREIEAAALESERNSAAPRERSSTSELAERSHYDGLLEEDGIIVDQEQEQREGERDESEFGIRVELADGHSPAPTTTSYIGHGGSEYTSDFQEEEEREQEEGFEIYADVEEGEEEEEGETDERGTKQRIEYTREEEEEEEEDR